MVHIFQPKLINPPYKDPGLFISLFGKKYSYLIDAGDLSKLSNKDILKIDKLFITHTHMDHFYGFDRILRTFLGKEKHLKVFGPKNIIKNINGKLQGYTWNLVENYNTDFTVEVFEILNTKIKKAVFKCKKKFKLEEKEPVNIYKNIIVKEDDHIVRGIVLDHKTPSISYILEENFHINILKTMLEKYNLPTGKWLTYLKDCIYNNKLNEVIEIEDKKFHVKELMDNITKITPGQKVTYITDIVFSRNNIRKLKQHIGNTTFLYIEASFLNRERKRAKERWHLTAKQAGYIAKIARAKKVFPFHISPIHIGEYNEIKKELKKERFS